MTGTEMTEPRFEPRLAISNRCERLFFRPQEVEDFFLALAAAGESSLMGELSIVFLNDSEMAELHGRFLRDPTTTDVITFPGDAKEDFAGEICVSAERAWIESSARGISLSQEICLYLAHGWLHLMGLDDRTAEDRLAMRQAEKEVLTVAEPLPAFSWS